ncbi:hypothetical protein [Hymenobacter sp. CRA2]|uniref:hypothetical protein n=1 Tax=Hymenobacter sp. CRA2 TaxID=1955620 RepID=UPI000990096B|nr:hypothetical protein [Hymenobacter sp. CRA2]OON70144.1 hypothetical protein B0919_05240 [Hymenobacter sp. CRA2]
MKLLLLLLGNAAILCLLAWWLRRQLAIPTLRRWLLPTLALRLLAGAVSVWRPTEDARFFHLWAGRLTDQLWAAPGQWLQTLGQDTFQHEGNRLIYHGYSNTFFFIKVLSALNVLTAGSMLVTALYLSLASFLGCWLLTKVLSRQFAGTRGAAIIGLLLWPSAVYWSSGLTKESLLLAGCATLLAAALVLLYGQPRQRLGWVALALLGAWLSFKMRFFFGGALLALLLCLAVVRVGQLLLVPLRRRRWQLLLFAATFVLGLRLGSEVVPVLRFNKFASQLTRTYAALRVKSLGRPHVALPELAPTAESILRHTPKAVASALYRPFAWEGDSVFYGFAAWENLGLLILSALALWDWARRRSVPMPFAVTFTLVVYTLLMAALLGLSTPNLGTLSRYRAPWLPLLVYVLVSQPTASGWLRRLRVFGRVGRAALRPTE